MPPAGGILGWDCMGIAEASTVSGRCNFSLQAWGRFDPVRDLLCLRALEGLVFFQQRQLCCIHFWSPQSNPCDYRIVLAAYLVVTCHLKICDPLIPLPNSLALKLLWVVPGIPMLYWQLPLYFWHFRALEQPLHIRSSSWKLIRVLACFASFFHFNIVWFRIKLLNPRGASCLGCIKVVLEDLALYIEATQCQMWQILQNIQPLLSWQMKFVASETCPVHMRGGGPKRNACKDLRHSRNWSDPVFCITTFSAAWMCTYIYIYIHIYIYIYIWARLPVSQPPPPMVWSPRPMPRGGGSGPSLPFLPLLLLLLRLLLGLLLLLLMLLLLLLLLLRLLLLLLLRLLLYTTIYYVILCLFLLPLPLLLLLLNPTMYVHMYAPTTGHRGGEDTLEGGGGGDQWSLARIYTAGGRKVFSHQWRHNVHDHDADKISRVISRGLHGGSNEWVNLS